MSQWQEDGGNDPDLVAFLAARLDEDERDARKAQKGRDVELWVVTNGDTAVGVDYDPLRVLADVAMKRALLEIWSRAFQNPRDAHIFAGPDWDRVRSCAQWTVRQLAAPYASHPDFRAEWSPNEEGTHSDG